MYDKDDNPLSGGRAENESMESFRTRSVFVHMKLMRPRL